MKVLIHGDGIEVTNNMQRQIFEKLALALDRLEEDVLSASLHLEETNSPLIGGEGKACRIIIQLLHQDPLVIEDIDKSVDIVIERATDRLGVLACQRLTDIRRLNRATSKKRLVEEYFSYSW